MAAGARRHLAYITRPAETIMFVDDTSYIGIYDPGVSSSGGGYYGKVEARHNDQANAAFCDGHVKSYQRSVIASPNSRNTYWVTP